jgi:hypothetical protein
VNKVQISTFRPGVADMSDHESVGEGGTRIPRTPNANSANNPYMAAAVAWALVFMTTNVVVNGGPTRTALDIALRLRPVRST